MGTKLPAPHFLQVATVTVIDAPASAAAVYASIFAVAVM
jgi:hypothetical protein